jgi:hypothetical protein
MDPNAPRGNQWPGEPDTYWRRRVFALAAGLGILGLLAWACSGALSGAQAPRQTSVTSSPAAAQSAAGNQSGAGSQSVGSPSAAAASGKAAGSGAGGRASGSPTASPTATPTSTARHNRNAHVTPARRPGSACAPADVVVSLFTSQQTYRPAAPPQFTVAVVNTGRPTCAFAVDARSLRLVVKSGQVRVWSPADCTRGTVTEVARLPRGVPYVTYLSWNRIRSSPHCPSSRLTAAPGTYTATVTSGTVHSNTDVFVLR